MVRVAERRTYITYPIENHSSYHALDDGIREAVKTLAEAGIEPWSRAKERKAGRECGFTIQPRLSLHSGHKADDRQCLLAFSLTIPQPFSKLTPLN